MRIRSTILLSAGLVVMGACESSVGPVSPSSPSFAFSTDPCSFTVTGTTMQLNGDCGTSTSIVIPDGFTLNGGGFTITAVDPGPGSPFLGGVLENGGATAHVTEVHIRANGLASVCRSGDDRLRGIYFVGASGSVTQSSVVGVNKGASGCQEGNSIEVRNLVVGAPTVTVEIAHNVVDDYQKTGVVCVGEAVCSVHHNDIGASATQANLAANSVQYSAGATGDISHNAITGNSWCGPSDFVATAVLIFDSGPGLEIGFNRIDGNSDVGIYAFTDGANIEKNSVEDVGADCNAHGYDIGIGDYGSSYPGTSNTLSKNRVTGFDMAYDPPTEEASSQQSKKANRGKGRGSPT